MLSKIFGDKIRFLSSIVIVAITIPLLAISAYAGYAGRVIGIVGILLISILGLYEIFSSMKVNKLIALFMSLVVIPFFVLSFANKPIDDLNALLDVPHEKTSQRMYWALHDIRIYAFPLAFSFIPLLLDDKYRKGSKNVFIDLFIFLCVNLLVCVFAKTLWVFATGSLWKILYFLLIAIIADVFAYLGGLNFGKKWFGGAKFSPNLSPKKTWAGFVIGVSAASIFAVLAGFFGNIWSEFGGWEKQLIVSFLVGIPLAILAPFGDLAFSAIKRWSSVKDFSNLIPGHGGVFDRIDAMSLIVVLGAIVFFAAH